MSFVATHVVVGATRPDRVVAFLQVFGFEVAGRQRLGSPAASSLYGLETGTEEVLLGAGGANRGALRVVATPHEAPPRGPCAVGPHAIDLYTRDIGRSLALAEAAGATVGPIVDYAVGPLAIRELKVVGPDHVVLVFLQVDRRRSSRLDLDPSRLHSEVHSAVWTVARVDDVLPFWTAEAGQAVLLDATLREPAVARLMELPRPDTALRLCVLADEAAGPPRIEFVEFPDDPHEAVPAWPIRAGLYALGAETADLAAGTRAMARVAWGAPVVLPDGGRAVAGEAPGGVRVELREPRAGRVLA